ncbi:MAG: LytTR family DNA-binding domain-containing protein, partial [Bacteroidota bacterium]
LLKHFEEVPFEIIFVTGYNDYALDALKVSAVDYLLKPVETEELIQAVQKAQTKIANKKLLKKYEVLKHNIDHIGGQQSKVVIPGAAEYSLIKVADIIRCEGWQKYTRIHLQDGTNILSSYNIGVFRDMLETYDFYAPHKSHLINIYHIQKYLKKGVVVMSDQVEVPVSRRKKEHFLQYVLKK